MTSHDGSATLTRNIDRPTIGRLDEIERGVDALASGGGLVICGAIGVGKSHLARRLVSAATCGNDSWAHIALAATAARRDVDLSALEPVLGPLEQGRAASVDAAAVRSHAVGAEVMRRLAARGGEGRRYLVQVDDGHLLDEVSADVLSALCRSGSLTLLLTLCDDGSAPAAVTGLWRDRVVERIDLSPFTRQQTELWLRSTLGEGLAPDVIHKGWLSSRGNPMLLSEAVRSALDDAALATSDGTWRWEGRPRPGPRLIQLVRDDLDRLDRSERDVADVVALAGSVGVRRLERLSPVGALDRLLAQGLLVVDERSTGRPGCNRVMMRHSLVGEAVRGLVGPERRRYLFRRTFGPGSGPADDRDVGTRPGEPPEALVRQVLWALASDVPVGPVALVASARAAVLIEDYDHCVRLATVALEQLEPADLLRVEAWTVRATGHRFRHEPVRARRDLERALDLLRSAPAGDGPNLRRWVEVAEVSADLHQCASDDPTTAMAVLDEVEAVVAARGGGPGAAHRHDLAVGRTSRAGWAGDHGGAVPAALAVMADAASSDRDRARVAAPTALGLAMAGQLDQALDISTRGLRHARSAGDSAPWAFDEATTAHLVVLVWRGELADAVDLLDEVDGLDGRPRIDAAMQHMRKGRLALARGRRNQAVALLSAASEQFEVRDPHARRASALGWEALARASLGQAARARTLRSAAQAAPLGTARVAQADLRHALAMVGAWLGEADAANRLLDLAALCSDEGLALVELNARWAAAAVVWAGDRDLDLLASMVAPVTSAAAAVDGELARLRVAHVEAMSTGDDALADRIAASLSERGVWSPVASGSVTLTPRQREVATLAAQGLTSRDIAGRLFVSTRTVDTHLAHVFTKLGLNSRRQLADALTSRSDT